MTTRRTFAATTACALLTAVVTVLLPASPAAALPETPVVAPSGSSATRTGGLGFDTCTAPSAATMRAWRASPYGTANIYFGGSNRGCAQPELTAAWVRSVTAMGWRLLPTYFGRQVSCAYGAKPYRFTLSTAASYGDADAADAVARARALGLAAGSALYADVEHYDVTGASCSTAVRRYVSAWTKRLHATGYLAGVYVHQDSGALALSQSYSSTTYARPDAVWSARYNGNRSLTGWPTVPNAQWATHQRLRQYQGPHTETWGGASLNIDSDSLDAPVATVARAYRVTSTTPLNGRSGPSAAYPTVRSFAPASTVTVLCQGRGTTVGTTTVWDRLSDGTWVSDRYVSTPSGTGFSPPLPQCSYPGQVTGTGTTPRTGPGTSYATSGAALRPGALAYVTCQKTGTLSGTTRVWDRLDDGRWVSDRYVSNRSDTTWSAPVPRCP